MDITITGRGVEIPDRFEDYATEKAEKVAHLADKALALEIRVIRHHETNGTSGDDRVELTLIGPGPIVRAESRPRDKYAAFDLALDKLLERIRQAKDRKQGASRPARRPSLAAGDEHRRRIRATVVPASELDRLEARRDRRGAGAVAEGEEAEWTPGRHPQQGVPRRAHDARRMLSTAWSSSGTTSSCLSTPAPTARASCIAARAGTTASSGSRAGRRCSRASRAARSHFQPGARTVAC